MREKKEINIQIGEQIKLAREQSRVTQEQLAERVDVSPQYVSDLERGVVGVSIATLKRICVALNVSSDQILFARNNDVHTTAILMQCSSLNSKQQEILCEIIAKYVEALHTTE